MASFLVFECPSFRKLEEQGIRPIPCSVSDFTEFVQVGVCVLNTPCDNMIAAVKLMRLAFDADLRFSQQYDLVTVPQDQFMRVEIILPEYSDTVPNFVQTVLDVGVNKYLLEDIIFAYSLYHFPATTGDGLRLCSPQSKLVPSSQYFDASQRIAA